MLGSIFINIENTQVEIPLEYISLESNYSLTVKEMFNLQQNDNLYCFVSIQLSQNFLDLFWRQKRYRKIKVFFFNI